MIFKKSTLLATAIEFIHTATLLHDDVVDGLIIEEELKAANVVWGNGACVLSCDFFVCTIF